MLKSKGPIIGIGIALVASALLVAGLALTATTGAATDGSGTDIGNIGPGPEDLTVPTEPSTPDSPDSPPASPVEPVSPIPDGGAGPITDPNAGGAGAGAGGPGSLPDAGYGSESRNSGLATLIALLGLAGAALLGAGATRVAAKRQG